MSRSFVIAAPRALGSWNWPYIGRGLVLVAFLLVGLSVGGCANAPGGQPSVVWLGQLSDGAPAVSVKVASWKEKRFDGIVQQRTDFSCGAAVMATVFNEAFGHRTTERQVLVNMLKVADPDIVREKGFSLLDMKNYAQSIGFGAEGYAVDYATLVEFDLPSIVLLDIKGYKHFVVVRRAWDDRIAIGDPALGNKSMPRNEFEAAWNDVIFVMTGDGYDPNNALIDPPPPLSALRLLENYAQLPAADSADFGFGPGNVFSF